MNETIFKAIWIVAGIIMLIFYSKRKHTVRSALSGMLSRLRRSGITALFRRKLRIRTACESL